MAFLIILPENKKQFVLIKEDWVCTDDETTNFGLLNKNYELKLFYYSPDYTRKADFSGIIQQNFDFKKAGLFKGYFIDYCGE